MQFDLDNMYCGAIRRGDIFVVDNHQHKNQAVVVLQDDILNQSLPTVICALIAPYRKGAEIFVNEVKLTKDETGLGKDGVCYLHKVVTLDRRSMVAKKGELAKEKLKEIYVALDATTGRFRDR